MCAYRGNASSMNAVGDSQAMAPSMKQSLHMLSGDRQHYSCIDLSHVLMTRNETLNQDI